MMHMEPFKIFLNGCEIDVYPQLHENFYSIKWNNQSAMLGKGNDGEWEISLQTSGASEIQPDLLGREIEIFMKDDGFI